MKGNFPRSSPTCRCLLAMRCGGIIPHFALTYFPKKREGRIVCVCEPAWTQEAEELPARGPGERVLLELCLDKQASRLVRPVGKHIWHGAKRSALQHVSARVTTERYPAAELR